MRDSPRGDARRPGSDMTALAGRVALVTGAGRRVGRAIALALGAQGMRLVVPYSASADFARDTARLISEFSAPAITLPAALVDVSPSGSPRVAVPPLATSPFLRLPPQHA